MAERYTSTSSSERERGSSKDKDVTTTVKKHATEVAETAKKSASELATAAKTQTKEAATQVSQQAQRTIEEATTRAEVTADAQKEKAATRLAGVASALRETGKNLQEQPDDSLSHYAHGAADQIDQWAHYLEKQDVRGLLHDVQQLAHRQPELFVAGALATGFFLGRFFKSSTAQSPHQYAPSSQLHAQQFSSEKVPDTGGRMRYSSSASSPTNASSQSAVFASGTTEKNND